MASQTATSRLAPPAWRTILYRHHSRNSWRSICGRFSYLNADPFTENIKILNRLWAGSFSYRFEPCHHQDIWIVAMLNFLGYLYIVQNLEQTRHCSYRIFY